MPSSTPVKRSRRPDPELRFDPEMVAAINALGQRLTRHRANVIKTLLDSDHPLTVDEVVANTSVPLSTAYRNLSELCDAGVCARVVGTDRVDRFEVAEAFTHRHHHHLVCTVCGKVIDFDSSPEVERAITKELAALRKTLGFSASGHVFDVHGVCAACAS